MKGQVKMQGFYRFRWIIFLIAFASCEDDPEEARVSTGEPKLGVFSAPMESPQQEGFSDLLQERLATTRSAYGATSRCGCIRVLARLSSEAQINPPWLTAGGPMRGNLRGTVDYRAYLEDIVEVSSISSEDPVNPSASFVGTWILSNRKGTLTFRDVGVFEQIPNGLGTSFSRVINGTGYYEGASGFLFLNLISDDTGLKFEEILRGVIYCRQHPLKSAD